MPLLPSLGRTVGSGVKAARLLVRGSVRASAWATRRVGSARARGAAGEIGMIRLFDLHAVSCAGDALIAIGLAGTIFSVPLGEARSKVALYLLITMVPFALLAPVVGPLLDHFRHGRRYALATTFLGRAFLAYVMADHLTGWALYPAAFGVLALSRAYGVARSAAVPRLLPAGIGLSQAGARASVYGTFAGALVAPIGLLAFKFGPQWPLRVASVIFMVGMVVALRLPPRADSDPPEALPRAWRTVLRIRGTDMPLSGKLVAATLIGSSSLRLLYGFMLLFLTFAIMGGQLEPALFGVEVSRGAAAALVGGALVLGTFISTAAGTSLRIRRPLALQSSGLVVVAGVTVLTTIFYTLAMVTLLALLTAVFSGIAKLAVDASIQERVPERQRATAFAHSETALMLAWVAGGGLGIIPFPGRLGIGFAALLAVLAAARAGWAAARLHNERLSGRPDAVPTPPDDDTAVPAGSGPGPAAGQTDDPTSAYEESDVPARPRSSRHPDAHEGARPSRRPDARESTRATARTGAVQRLDTDAPAKGRRWWQGSRKSATVPAQPSTGEPATRQMYEDEPTSRMPGESRGTSAGGSSRVPSTAGGRGSSATGENRGAFAAERGRQGSDAGRGREGSPAGGGTEANPAPPGYHVYRPSSAGSGTRDSAAADGEDS